MVFIKKSLRVVVFVSSVLDFILSLYYYFFLLLVRLNLIRVQKTGAPDTISQYFVVNFNNIMANSFTKVSLLQTYSAIHEFGIYLFVQILSNLAAFFDNDNLYIKDYKLVVAGHPENVRRGGVCQYFKEPLPVIRLLILS